MGRLNTAVLLIIFNRTDTAIKTLDAIRKVKPKKLYVASDGPRSNVSGEDDVIFSLRERMVERGVWY